MAIGLGDVAYGVSAVCLGLFAGWLLYLSPQQRATRTLSALLLSIAFLWGGEPATETLPLEAKLILIGIMPAAICAIGVSTIYFLSIYPRPRGWLGRSPWGGWAAFGGWLALAALFVTRRELWTVPVVAEGEIVSLQPGPLALLSNAWTMTSALLLILLAREHGRAPAGPVRRAMALVLAGFMASALVWQVSLTLNDLGRRLTPEAFGAPITRAQFLLEEATMLVVLAAPAIMLFHARRSREAARMREAAAVAIFAALCIVAAVLVWALGSGPAPGAWSSQEQQVLDALGGASIAALCGYALLKHRLFDIDVKLRWTISRGTIAALFVGVFFVASQVAQAFLEDSMGWALGGVIAGVMLFAIAPLQRVADRVAAAAVPVQQGSPHERRLELYRLALAVALADRAITRDEERHLAKLAEELGVTHTEALGAREEMEREMGLASVAGGG